MSQRPNHISVEVSGAGLAGITPALVRRWVRRAAKLLRLPSQQISVAFVGAKVSRNLNGKYRNKDRPTNVLTFPLANDRTEELLGEIILCPKVIRAETKGLDYQARLRFLIEHGCIHLLGLDHHKPNEIKEWVKLENRLKS